MTHEDRLASRRDPFLVDAMLACGIKAAEAPALFEDPGGGWQRTAAWVSVGLAAAALTTGAVLATSSLGREEDIQRQQSHALKDLRARAGGRLPARQPGVGLLRRDRARPGTGPAAGSRLRRSGGL